MSVYHGTLLFSNFSDNLYVPVGAPSIFGAIQQVQNVAAQRAQAEAIGREAYARAIQNAINRERAIAAQMAALRAAAAQQQQALQAQMQERAAQRAEAMRAQQEAARKAAELEMLGLQERDLISKRDAAAALAGQQTLGAYEEAMKNIENTKRSALQQLSAIASSPQPSQFADIIPESFAKAVETGADEGTLKTLAAEIQRKLEQQQKESEQAQKAADIGNELLRSRFASLLQDQLDSAQKELSRASLSPWTSRNVEASQQKLSELRQAMQSTDPSIMAATTQRLLGDEAVRKAYEDVQKDLATRYSQDVIRNLSVLNGIFVPRVERPISPKLVQQALESALKYAPKYKPPSQAEIMKQAQKAQDQARAALDKEIERIRRLRMQLLSTPVYR